MEISEDTVIIVTGATRGLGRALIEFFANYQAKVYGTYKSSLEDANQLEATFPNVKMVKVDNSYPEDIENFVKKVVEIEGRIDILINNAGAIQERKKIVELSLVNWKTLLDVHLTGAFLYSKHTLPVMLRRNSGLIINVTSRFGLFENAKAEFGSLNVAKAGMNMLTKVLFQELQGTKIRVNSVLPAPTLTDFLETVFSKEEINSMKQNQVLGEISEFVKQVKHIIDSDSINGEFVKSERLK